MKWLFSARTFLLICAAFAALFAGAAQAATIIHVNHAATGAATGVDWANAFPDLQQALTAARGIVSGGGEAEIWVAKGTYTPGVTPSDSFEVTSRIALYGGFAGFEATREERDPAANPTVASGDIDADDVGDDSRCDAEEIRGENSEHVIVVNDLAGDITIDGFVVTAGDAGSGDGGGIRNIGGYFALGNVTICGNRARRGGGVYNALGTHPGIVWLNDALIFGNQAQTGAGMVNDNSGLHMTNVSILSNTAWNGNGGAILNRENADLTLTNVRIIGNRAEDPDGLSGGRGGGICSDPPGRYHSEITMTNVLIYDNFAAHSGGGLSLVNTVTRLFNVTVTENDGGTADALSIGRLPFFGSYPPALLRVVNSVIWGNATHDGGGNPIDDTPADDLHFDPTLPVTIANSDIQMPNPSDAPWPGTGNINSDPLFDTSALDVRLSESSPAIDTGDRTLYDALHHDPPVFDLDGNPRVIGADMDMGAYEYEPPLVLSAGVTEVSCNGGSDGSIDLTISGGTGVYDVSWSPGGADTANLSGLTAGTYTVTVRDDDGCEATQAVVVSEPSVPVVTLSVAPMGEDAYPIVQYSDRLQLDATVAPRMNGTISYTLKRFATGVVVQTLGTAAVVSGVAETITPQVLVVRYGRDGRYGVDAVFTSSAGCPSVATQNLIVLPEEATITPDPANGSAFTEEQSNAGFVLRFTVRETSPEPGGDPPGAEPGDINLPGLSVALAPVDGSAAIAGTCVAEGTAEQFQYVSRAFVCSFSNVPVDAYELSAALIWRPDSYSYQGLYIDALTVYDPAADFVTGGGKFTYPDSSDMVNFGLVYRFTGKDKNTPRGNLVVLRHMENGDVCRVKSNGIGAPAVSGNTAAFSGKANSLCTRPDGTIYGEAGNLGFTGWVEDNEATGEPDRFWIRVPGTVLSMEKPGASNAAPLTGGNIQVPQKKGK